MIDSTEVKGLTALDTPYKNRKSLHWYSSIYEIINANQTAGYHFFSPESKRFFDSGIGRKVYYGCYFITSEQFHSSSGDYFPRKYTIRICWKDGSIDTIGDFQQFKTREEAVKTIHRIKHIGMTI